MVKISLGICCMEEKLRCTVMKYFLSKLKEYSEIQVIEFDVNTIFNKSIYEWPIVDSFLSFYSNGFPLDKAIQYSELRKPYLINDLHAQKILQDRQKVNQLLESYDIPSPKSLYILRDQQTNKLLSNYTLNDEYIEIDGTKIYKPFIEKPLNSDDHNNYIYYPKSQGGGCRKLFRKIGNSSSDYFKDINSIREKGSYTYEEFYKIDGFKDVKVYSTQTFSYSELRKSPSVDGCVERTNLGKEKRTVTTLSDEEFNISFKINKAFKQFVCGFDILRVNGKSFVCDVNGWSLVKGDHFKEFYDQSSRLLYHKLINHFTGDATSSNTSPSYEFSPSSSPPTHQPSASSPLFNSNNKNSNNINLNNNNNNNNLSKITIQHIPFDLINISISASSLSSSPISTPYSSIDKDNNTNNNNNKNKNNNNNNNNNNNINNFYSSPNDLFELEVADDSSTNFTTGSAT